MFMPIKITFMRWLGGSPDGWGRYVARARARAAVSQTLFPQVTEPRHVLYFGRLRESEFFSNLLKTDMATLKPCSLVARYVAGACARAI